MTTKPMSSATEFTQQTHTAAESTGRNVTGLAGWVVAGLAERTAAGTAAQIQDAFLVIWETPRGPDAIYT